MNGILSRKKRSFFTKHDIECTALLLPEIIGFFVFTIYPIIWAVQKAFYYYNGIQSRTTFVGLDNFKALFTTNGAYWSALGNSFLFTIGKLPFEIPIALILAIIVSKNYKGFKASRVILYLPTIISVAVVGLVFTNMFSYFGYINAVLMKLGIIKSGIDFFASKGSAMMVIIIASIWQTFGINTIYFLVALSNIPTEVYESAKLDGAGTLVTFFKITLPLISPVFATILLLAINGSLQTGDIILTLTNGAPGGQTEVVMTYLLKSMVPGFAQTNADIGFGCAVAMVNAVIFSLVALIYIRLSKKVVSYF
ncbi:MAG: sugar ABC transporter permease [Clostridia bacterium]|nr:sugar ABC transporter permease [Clostridia bacterium]